MPLSPCATVVCRPYWLSIRLQLGDFPCKEHVCAVHPVSACRQSVYVQVRKVSYLEPYVGSTDLPCVLVHYHADVAACLVHARLA